MTLPRCPETVEALVEALCKSHGDLTSACRECGVSLRAVVAWLANDTEAAAAVKEAQMIGWASLEHAAYQRAVHGVEKPVWFKGEQVGTETHYSDGLLAKMLDARVPGYGENPVSGGMTINVAVMPRAETYEEWLGQREAALKPKILEAEYVEVGPAINGLPDVL